MNLNPKNPEVRKAVLDSEDTKTLLAVTEVSAYERIIERGVSLSEVDLRVHALNYSFQSNAYADHRNVPKILSDADVFLVYLQTGEHDV